MKQGLLLVNLGTPASYEPNAVGDFLKEFLMDPHVIELPYLLRWFLVHKMIVPKRKNISAKNYLKIWTKRGSPLLFHSQDLREKLQFSYLDCSVKLAMRYGQPSLKSALESYLKERVLKLKVLPLFPQYSSATTQSVIDEIMNICKKEKWHFDLSFIGSFADHSGFIQPSVQLAREYLGGREADHLLLSFHGLPEKMLKRQDKTKSHCLQKERCCEQPPASPGLDSNCNDDSYRDSYQDSYRDSCQDSYRDSYRDCYRAQCYKTAKALALGMGWPLKKGWTMAFQSRLGKSRWTQPYTHEVVQKLVRQGVRHLAVMTPSFVSDCLETLEEIQMGIKEDFISAGGKSFFLVPCLNSRDEWVSGLQKILCMKGK